MTVKGLVVLVSITGNLLAVTSPHKEEPVRDTQETLESLFDGVDTSSGTTIDFDKVQLIDLESFLEELPELEDEFKSLSDEEKNALIATINLINKEFIDILSIDNDSIITDDHSATDHLE